MTQRVPLSSKGPSGKASSRSYTAAFPPHRDPRGPRLSPGEEVGTLLTGGDAPHRLQPPRTGRAFGLVWEEPSTGSPRSQPRS